MNCTFAIATPEMVENLDPAALEFLKASMTDWLTGPTLKCHSTIIHPSLFVGQANSSGWYPETSARGMLQRGYFDIFATPMRYDSVDNPDALILDKPIASSELILASSQKIARIKHLNIFQSMNPFNSIVYVYLFYLSLFIAVMFTTSHRLRILIKRCRRTSIDYTPGMMDIKYFFRSLYQVLQQLTVQTSDKPPITRSFGEKSVWLSTWITVFILYYGYISGLFSTDLNFTIRPDRVESLQDIMNPKFKAIPACYGQVEAIEDFVVAKPGSLKHQIYRKMQKENTIYVIEGNDDVSKTITDVKQQLEDPRIVLIEYEMFMELMIRIFDAVLFYEQRDSNEVKEDKGFMRKGKESSHPVLFGPALRPDMKPDERTIILKHVQKFFEGGCFAKGWDDAKTGILSRIVTPETPETRRKADLNYFDRLEKDERMNPSLPEPFNIDFFRPLFFLVTGLFILSVIVFILEHILHGYKR